MIFGLIIFLLLAGIAYFHYIQGGLSSAISAFSAVIAALLAVGYYESIVVMFEPGKMADYAPGMILISLYGLSYITLRVLMDAAVPGNIRMPLWVDRGAAAAFGLVAGICATGVFALGAQLLPFGPSLAGFTSYGLSDRGPLMVKREFLGGDLRNDQDLQVTGELTADELDPASRTGLLVATDQFVIGLAHIASDGAFKGANSYNYVHPDPLLQAFANRLGPDTSGKRVIINAKRPAVEVPTNGLFLLPLNTAAADSEIPAVRGDKTPKLEKNPDRQLLVVRASFMASAQDEDSFVRLTPAAARLVIGGRTFYPIGTMMPNGHISLNRIDDQLLIKDSADLVYQIDETLLTRAATAGKVKSDAMFVEFKMLGRIDLGGYSIADRWSEGGGNVLRKKASPALSPPAPAAPAAPVTPPAAAPNT